MDMAPRKAEPGGGHSYKVGGGDAKRTELIRGSMAEEERLGSLGLCLFQGALTTGFMFYPKGNHFGVCIGQNSYCSSVTVPGFLLLQALS